MSIAENYAAIRRKIDETARRVGRNPSEIDIVAVSKYHPLEKIEEAIAAGIRVFGENRVQEALEKINLVSAPDVSWHLIGTLQKNKVKYLAGKFALIHSVDSFELLEVFVKEAAKYNAAMGNNEYAFDLLLQVNISEEPQKHGFAPEDVLAVARRAVALPGIRIRGLMGMAHDTDNPEETRTEFRLLKQLSVELNAPRNNQADAGADAHTGATALSTDASAMGIDAPVVSMGMSHDYVVAVEEGSTLVRIGSAIFA